MLGVVADGDEAWCADPCSGLADNRRATVCHHLTRALSLLAGCLVLDEGTIAMAESLAHISAIVTIVLHGKSSLQF